MRPTILLLAAAVVLLPAQTAAPGRNDELHRLFRDYFEMLVRNSPEFSTRLGRNDRNDRWSDLSPKAAAERRKELLGVQGRLEPFRRAALNQQDRVSLELLDYRVRASLESLDRLGHYFQINHLSGPQVTIFSVTALAPARTVKDYEDRIARLRAIPAFVDGLIAAAEDARARGLVPPRVVIERLLTQLDAQRSPKPEQSALLAAFRKFPAVISPDDRQRLSAAATKAYTESFQPAWTRYRDYIARSYLPHGRSTLGISALSNGKDHYAFLVRQSTTTSLSPGRIHTLGQAEVERIEGEMALIRKELGFTGTHEEFSEKLLYAPEMRFKTEAEILTHARDIAKRIDPELPALFRRLPRMPYGVQAIPADRARSAAPHYQAPAADGSRAGNFFLRTVDPQTQSKCCMEALILHEAVPGHHLQVALALEMDDLPEFRRFGGYAAYGEGWGLYAESLGPELNMYQTPYERYGKLQSELVRALRLVTDTGIHESGWSREQAIQTMSRGKGGWITGDFLASEVDRYIASPAQALAYKIGELKIKELRARAEKALAGRFDIREFHDVVLRNGPVPLAVLESEVESYLAAKK